MLSMLVLHSMMGCINADRPEQLTQESKAK